MEGGVFNIALFFRGYFGYEGGHVKYFGQKLIIEEQDSDFWPVYEAEEQLMRLGVEKDDIAALWYKDPEHEEIETGLQTFVTYRDALEMVRLGLERGLVELYVVHEGEGEGFPEIGYIDVGGNQGVEEEVNDAAGGEDEAVGGGEQFHAAVGVVETAAGDAGEAAAVGEENADVDGVAVPVNDDAEDGIASVEKDQDVDEHEVHAAVTELHEIAKKMTQNLENGATKTSEVAEGIGASEEHELEHEKEDGSDGGVSSGEETDDEEYVPSDNNTDSADDVYFTDSEEDFDLDDHGFGNEAGPSEVRADEKGKKVLNHDFSNDEGEDSEELEEGHAVGGFGRGDEDNGEEEDEIVFLVHKPIENMANYRWQVGTVYASRDSKMPCCPMRCILLGECECVRNVRNVRNVNAPHVSPKKLRLMAKLPPREWG